MSVYRKPKRRPPPRRRLHVTPVPPPLFTLTPVALAAFMEHQASEWEAMWDLGIPEVKRAMNAAARDLREGAAAAKQVSRRE